MHARYDRVRVGLFRGFKYDFDHNDRSVLQFLGNHVTEWVGMVLEKNGF